MTAPQPPAPGPESGKGRVQHRLRLFLTLHLPSIMIGFGTGATVVVMGTLSQSFGAAFGAAIMIFVLQQLGTAVAPIPTGFLIDRIGRRGMLLAGPLVIAASSLLIVRALLVDGSFVEILIYRFFTGVGEQMWMLSRLAVIADTGRNQQRGKQITSMIGVQQIGNLTGPLAGGALSVALGPWTPFALHAAVVILGAVPSFYLVKETLVRQSATVGGAGSGASLQRTRLGMLDLRTPPIPYVLAAQFLANVTRGGVFGGSILVLYASYAYGLSEFAIGTLRSTTALAGIPITFGAGFLMDRFGRKFTIVPGLLLSGLAMVFLALTDALNMSVSMFIVAFVMVHLAVSLISGNMQTLGTDVAPAHARGAFFGVSRMISQTGSTVSPASFGLFASLMSYGAGFFFLGASAFAAALVVLVAIPETLRKDEGAPQPPIAQPPEPPATGAMG